MSSDDRNDKSSDSTNRTNGASPAGKKRRRGLWWKIPLALLILLILLILLLPTIASTGLVRSSVIGKVNASAPGKLAISDWSLGWFSGAKLKNVEWTDAQGRKLASVGEIDTPITVMQLARGDWHFGEITIRHVTANVLVPVSRKAPTGAPRPAGEEKRQPVNIPDVSARVRIEDIGGQVTFVGDNGRSAAVKLDRSTHVLLDMPGGSSPVKCDALVALAQEGGTGTASLAGTVNGIRPGPLDLAKLTGDGAVKLSGVDIDQAAGILRAMGQDLALKGALSGEVNVASPAQGQFTARGELAADNVVATLGKDQLTTSRLRIPVDAELSGAGDAARVIVRQLGVAIDQAQLALTADLPIKSLEELQEGKPASLPGKAHLTASVPSLPAVMNALPRTFKLEQGVQVTGGQFACDANLDIAPNGIAIAVPLSIKDVSATRGDRKIALKPLELNAAARLASLQPRTPADISDIAIDLNSSFATLSARGANAAKVNAKGVLDLAKMRDDLGSIVDLSMLRGGRITLELASREAGADSFDSDLKLQAGGLGIDLKQAEGSAPRHLEGGTVLLTAQTSYQNRKLSIRKPLELDVAGRLFEDAPGKPSRLLVDQAAQVKATVQADIGSEPKRVVIDQFSSIIGRGSLVVLGLPPNRPLELILAGKRGVTTDARLLVKADLAAIQNLQSQIAPTTQPAGKLEKGVFTGELFCQIAADGGVKAGLTQSKIAIDYISGSQRYTDEISADVSGSLSPDQSAAAINANVKGKLVNLALDGTAGLITDPQGSPQLKTLNVARLEARTDYCEASLSKPIIVSDVPALIGVFRGGSLPEDAQVGGELLVKSDLGQLMKVSATAPASTKQVTGVLTSKETIALKQRDLVADIAADVTSLKVLEAGKPVVEEPKLSVGAQVRVNPSAKWMELNQFAITSSSGMLDLQAFARVSELGSQNRIENGKLELRPDWAKLWPVIFAMMPPDKQAKIGEMVITGRKSNVITFDGSFPGNKPYADAVKLVRASGDLAFDQIDWKTRGITLSGTIPFRLEQGIAHFDYGQARTTEPLTCNEGKLDISRAAIDITGSSPRLDIPPKTRIATDIKLNSVMTSSLGKFSNPMFIDPEHASGFLSVTSLECTRLPLSTEIYDPANGGRAEFSIDVRQLDMASKGVTNVLGAMSIKPEKGKDRVTGEIHDGRVIIAEGRCIQKMDVQLGDSKFAFNGNMGLGDVTYSLLNVGVPRSVVSAMLDNLFHVEKADKYLPEQVGLKFSGPASALKLDKTMLNSLVRDVVRQQGTQAIVGGLLGRQEKSTTSPSQGQGAGKAPASQPTEDDIVGGLLRELTRPKEKK